jgi:glycosyltransferase involved in cell wall biosynthesis
MSMENKSSNNNKKILFISTAFSPENAVGAIRTTKLVKYLVRSGYEVTVISAELHNSSKIDNSLESIELEKIKRITVPQSKLFNKFFLNKRNQIIKENSASELMSAKNNSIKSRIKSQIYIYIQFMYSIFRNLDWSSNVMIQLKHNVDFASFDCIISSYPSLGSHWTSMKISRRYNIKWIAEFRDPLNYEANSNRFITFLNKIIQNKIVKNANVVTYISKEMISKLKQTEKTSIDKFYHIPNAFDSDDFEFIEQKSIHNNKLILSYVGSLYGGKRDLSVVFQTIRTLIDSEIFNKDNFQFIYAGKEIDVINSQAKNYGLVDIILNKGYISRKESIKIQDSSDIIVVATWNTNKDQGIVTGKLFECMLTNKVILGLVSGNLPNSEFKEIIREVNGGFVLEFSSPTYEKDKENLKLFIIDRVEEKLRLGKISSTYNSNIINYNYKNIIEKYIDLINLKN